MNENIGAKCENYSDIESDVSKKVILNENGKPTRKFLKKWFKRFGFMEKQENGLPQCIFCGNTYQHNKVDRLKEHFFTKHSQFDRDYPMEDPDRLRILLNIREEFIKNPANRCYSKIWKSTSHK
jgi:hypothetical protein